MANLVTQLIQQHGGAKIFHHFPNQNILIPSYLEHFNIPCTKGHIPDISGRIHFICETLIRDQFLYEFYRYDEKHNLLPIDWEKIIKDYHEALYRYYPKLKKFRSSGITWHLKKEEHRVRLSDFYEALQRRYEHYQQIEFENKELETFRDLSAVKASVKNPEIDIASKAKEFVIKLEKAGIIGITGFTIQNMLHEYDVNHVLETVNHVCTNYNNKQYLIRSMDKKFEELCRIEDDIPF